MSPNILSPHSHRPNRRSNVYVKLLYAYAIHSNNECLHLCAMLALNGSCSAASNNVNFISHSLNINKNDLLKLSQHALQHRLYSNFMPTANNCLIASQIRDLLHLRRVGQPHFTTSDFDVMLRHLCCE